MRSRAALAALLLGGALAAAAQQPPDARTPPFSIDDVMAAPFPEDLIVAPSGTRIAWLGYEEGRRNVWTAAAPDWTARRLTRYAADDGQELADLTFTADGQSLLYTRGGDPGGNWDETRPANPTSDPRGTEQAVWLVSVRTGATRRIGSGHEPHPSPAGDKVVWLYRDTLYVAPLRVAGAPRVLLHANGASGSPVWSPDGSLLAFVSDRGDHSLIGVLDLARNEVRWMAPATHRDELPRFSPDGTHVAFIRRPGALYSTGLPAPAPAPGTVPPPPFTIEVADVATGEAAEIYRSPAGPDGWFPGTAGEWGLMWAANDHLVFASELTGWIGLYSVPSSGGQAERLTATGCELENVTLSAGADTLYYAANCDDMDRRHIWRVAVAGGPPERLTPGDSIEWSPRPLAHGGLALLRSDAQRPAAPAVADSDGAAPHLLEGWPLPERFPLDALIAPTAVVVQAADSLPIHLQVFAPADWLPGVRRPAVIFFHGGPSREMLLGWHPMHYYTNAYAFNQYLVSRGFVVVSVNYRGGVGYGRAFRQAPHRGRFGAAEYLDVLAAAAYLRSRPDVDSAQIGLWGGSYGGYLTALGLARNSDLFAAGVDLHGVHDYAEDVELTSTWGVSDSAIALARASSPVADVDRWRSPVLLIQGDDDRNVHFQQMTDLARRLELRGVEVEEIVFPDEIHDFLLHRSWVRAYRAGADFLAARLRR